MSTHHVVTKDYPENLSNGILICGINFGFSRKDEQLENRAVAPVAEPLSFFSDLAVNKTQFRARILTWLSSWGLPFSTQAGEEGEFERSFFQTNWLDTQTRSIKSDGPITNKTLVEESEGFLKLLEERHPSVIIFIGSQLIEALNDIRIRDRVVLILGPRSGNAEILTAELPQYAGTKFKMLVQQYGDTSIVSLPHPQAWGLSNDYIAALKPPMEIMGKILGKVSK